MDSIHRSSTMPTMLPSSAAPTPAQPQAAGAPSAGQSSQGQGSAGTGKGAAPEQKPNAAKARIAQKKEANSKEAKVEAKKDALKQAKVERKPTSGGKSGTSSSTSASRTGSSQRAAQSAQRAGARDTMRAQRTEAKASTRDARRVEAMDDELEAAEELEEGLAQAEAEGAQRGYALRSMFEATREDDEDAGERAPAGEGRSLRERTGALLASVVDAVMAEGGPAETTEVAGAAAEALAEPAPELQGMARLERSEEAAVDAVEHAYASSRKVMGDAKRTFTAAGGEPFNPAMSPTEIERLGSIQGAVHMVKLTDHWAAEGLDRKAILDRAAELLLQFARPDQAKKILAEMNAAPIKQVYPLEILLRALEQRPAFFGKVRRAEVVEGRAALARGEGVWAGAEFRVSYPADLKLKAFALLGGGSPGYELVPYKNGVYHVTVDTPGQYRFALSAEAKGETLVDVFDVRVADPAAAAAGA